MPFIKNNNYASFHNLTFLYDDKIKYINEKYERIYHKKIKKYIKEHKEIIKNGDIIFIGSINEIYPEYGFATVKDNSFISDEYIRMDIVSGIYYKKAIDDINKFWLKYYGINYFVENDIRIDEAIYLGVYEPK